MHELHPLPLAPASQELLPREQVNLNIARILAELRVSRTDSACDELNDVLRLLGPQFPQSNYSLTVLTDYNALGEEQRRILDSWNVEPRQSRIPVAPPQRETTGTHGSGERQKIAESVATVMLDEHQNGDLVLAVNLWGRYTGMYHRLESALTLELPIAAVSALEITEGAQWRGQLARSAENIRNSSRGARWDSLVDAQISALKSFAKE